MLHCKGPRANDNDYDETLSDLPIVRMPNTDGKTWTENPRCENNSTEVANFLQQKLQTLPPIRVIYTHNNDLIGSKCSSPTANCYFWWCWEVCYFFLRTPGNRSLFSRQSMKVWLFTAESTRTPSDGSLISGSSSSSRRRVRWVNANLCLCN